MHDPAGNARSRRRAGPCGRDDGPRRSPWRRARPRRHRLPACRLSPGREASTAPWLRIGNTWLARWWRRPPSRDPTDGLFRLARATNRQGAGALAAQSAGDLSGPRMVARARPPVHPADPATRRRILLAAASGPRRPARPRARGIEQRTGRLGVAERQPENVGCAAWLSRATRPVSRKDPCQRPGLLLRMWAAGVPARLASRSVGRRASQPQCDLARLLRRGLETVDRAERSRAAFAKAAEPPLRRHRRAARQGRRGRSPRAAVPGVARGRAGRAVAGAAELLGR